MTVVIGTGDHYLSTYDITIFKFWGGGILDGGGNLRVPPPPV